MNEKFDINKLIDKPINELTEEEAEFFINWKAEQKFKEMQFVAEREILEKDLYNKINSYKEVADSAKSVLSVLEKQALAFYEKQ